MKCKNAKQAIPYNWAQYSKASRVLRQAEEIDGRASLYNIAKRLKTGEERKTNLFLKLCQPENTNFSYHTFVHDSNEKFSCDPSAVSPRSIPFKTERLFLLNVYRFLLKQCRYHTKISKKRHQTALPVMKSLWRNNSEKTQLKVIGEVYLFSSTFSKRLITQTAKKSTI